MYAVIYNRSMEHLANVIDLKARITRRVYDFDTSQYEGVCAAKISQGFIFQVREENGTLVYSGLMKNIVQEGKAVTFRGEDFRKMLDTEIALDYSTRWQYLLHQVIETSMVAFIDQTNESATILQANYDIGELDTVDTSWIANYYGEHLKVKVLSFLKVYLGYYGVHIIPELNIQTKTIVFYFRHNTIEREIRLEDFKHQATTTDVKTNKTLATIKFDTVEDVETHQYIPSTEDYYLYQPVGNRSQTNGLIDDPEEYFGSADLYNVGRAMRLDWTIGSGGISYYMIKSKSRARPLLPIKTYYLGLDNEIYADTIAVGNMAFPINTKIFEHEYLNQAQVLAIRELIDARYNENIILENNKTPIDLETLELNTKVKVYDQEGTSKTMPVSEIEEDENGLRVKLGFKKTLFTEVIKSP